MPNAAADDFPAGQKRQRRENDRQVPARPRACASEHGTLRHRSGRGSASSSDGIPLTPPGRSERGRGRSTSTISATRPGRGDITMTRSASSTASEIEWVTNRTAIGLALPQRQQRQAHLLARQRVERAERLIHEQDARILHKAAADRDALLHAAGQLARHALFEAGEARRAAAAHGRARARPARRGRIRLSGKVTLRSTFSPRQQRRRLEHHRRAFGRLGHQLAVEREVRRCRLHQPGDHAQQGRLAAAGRADDGDELPGLTAMVTSSSACTWPPRRVLKVLPTRASEITGRSCRRRPVPDPTSHRASGFRRRPSRWRRADPARSGPAPSPSGGR